PSTPPERPPGPAVPPCPTPTTQGTPSSRLTTAACEVAPPISVTIPATTDIARTSWGHVVGRARIARPPPRQHLPAVDGSPGGPFDRRRLVHLRAPALEQPQRAALHRELD